MDITGHRRELTKRNYDHRTIQHKLDNADYINNIKDDSDCGPPKEMRLDKNPANSCAIAQKSAPPKADRKDMSRAALKRHWDSKKENSVGIISCQPGGSSESTVIVAEKTLNGLRFVEKQVVEVDQNEITKVVEKEVKEKEVQKDEEIEVLDVGDGLSLEEIFTQQDTQWELNPNFGTAAVTKLPKNNVQSRDGEEIKTILKPYLFKRFNL